jgi:hypothetical protein
MPRVKPPFPAQSGVFFKPSNVNNVETYANAPLILRHGADWYHELGTEQNRGTRIFSFSGDIPYVGFMELAFGTPVPDVLAACGGIQGGAAEGDPVGWSAGQPRARQRIAEPHPGEPVLRAAGRDDGRGGHRLLLRSDQRDRDERVHLHLRGGRVLRSLHHLPRRQPAHDRDLPSHHGRRRAPRGPAQPPAGRPHAAVLELRARSSSARR